MHTSPGGIISVPCFTAQTADETLGPWIDVRGKAYLCFYVTGSAATISSGVISFEEAAPVGALLKETAQTNDVVGLASGTYSVITTATASDVTAGAQKAYHMIPGAFCFVRARISTAIGGGGNVSVGLVAY